MVELGQWVHLLAKRAENRVTPEKGVKDLYDAQNYLSMMQAKLSHQIERAQEQKLIQDKIKEMENERGDDEV